jgi:hypothetical protein
LIMAGKICYAGIQPDNDVIIYEPKRRLKYIYIAAPYTKPDPAVNTRSAILVAEQLRDKGFIPFVPHLTHLWHLISPHEIDYWYEYDIEWLKKCDALLRLPGESKGADNEVKVAQELGIPVFYDIDSIGVKE